MTIGHLSDSGEATNTTSYYRVQSLTFDPGTYPATWYGGPLSAKANVDTFCMCSFVLMVSAK
jgi:hypothetical protein